MTNIEVINKADDLYKELWEIQTLSGRMVNTNKPNTTIETNLVVFSEVDAEIFELSAGNPYIEVTVGLHSARGKVAKRTAYFEKLEEANLFISQFDEVKM